MKRFVIAVVAALALPAAALAGVDSGNGLKPFGTGTVSVDRGVITLANAAGQYSGVYSPSWANGFGGASLDQIGRASFDVKGTVNASSPRISLPLDTDGDGEADVWAYLSAFYCAGSSAATTGWFTADFTSASCLIYTSAGGPYAGLAGLAAAFPTATVARDEYTFVILDDVGSVQIANVDIGRGSAH